MGLDRTPRKSESGEIPEYPSGKYGAVTRKINEIKVLLGDPGEISAHLIKGLYAELIEKVFVYRHACEPVLNAIDQNDKKSIMDRYNKHNEEIESAKDEIKEIG